MSATTEGVLRPQPIFPGRPSPPQQASHLAWLPYRLAALGNMPVMMSNQPMALPTEPHPMVRSSTDASKREIALMNELVLKSGSSCHQCKTRRAIGELVFCGASNRRDAPAKRPRRACRKKYCTRCLAKFYSELLPSPTSTTEWSCPGCRGACICAACRRGKRPKDENSRAERPSSEDLSEEEEAQSQPSPEAPGMWEHSIMSLFKEFQSQVLLASQRSQTLSPTTSSSSPSPRPHSRSLLAPPPRALTSSPQSDAVPTSPLSEHSVESEESPSSKRRREFSAHAEAMKAVLGHTYSSSSSVSASNDVLSSISNSTINTAPGSFLPTEQLLSLLAGLQSKPVSA